MTALAEPLHIALQTANPANRIALRGVHLRATIAGMSIKATVEQTFVNLENRAIEALYTFPLPEGAAVCGFEVVFFDRVFTGIVDETDQAIEKYDEAISQGHGAYLLEQHRPDVSSTHDHLSAAGGSFRCSIPDRDASDGSGLLNLTRTSDDTIYSEEHLGSGWPTAQRSFTPPPPCSPAPIPPAKSRGLLARLRSAVGGSGPAKRENKRSERLYLCDRADSTQPPASPPANHLLAQDKDVSFFDATDGDELFTILATQTADGSFESSPLDTLINQTNFDRAATLSAIDQLLQKANIPSEIHPPIRQTLVVLLLLNLLFPDRKEAWNRAYKKGIWFIHEKDKLPHGVPQSWLQELTTKFPETPTPSPSNAR